MEAAQPVKSAPASTTPARGQTNTGEEAGEQGVSLAKDMRQVGGTVGYLKKGPGLT